ncbi:MAG: hypothetical protein J6I64_08490 [Lachnospiraceae bacterium]|nr:hypothetical protein [Lachnospiraceae bacterium]
MSVEKVNKYKEEKANRKEILEQQKKKAKQAKIALIAGAVVIVGLIVGAIGITARNEYKAYLNAQPDYNATQMLVGDLAGVLVDETEAETQEQTEAQETENATEAEG